MFYTIMQCWIGKKKEETLKLLKVSVKWGKNLKGCLYGGETAILVGLALFAELDLASQLNSLSKLSLVYMRGVPARVGGLAFPM